MDREAVSFFAALGVVLLLVVYVAIAAHHPQELAWGFAWVFGGGR
jgi:hypothetical protein